MNAYQVEERITEDEYQDYLNEVYEDIEICGMIMSQGTILKECDYTAFRTGYVDYLDSLGDLYICGVCKIEYDNEEEAEDCCSEEEVL